MSVIIVIIGAVHSICDLKYSLPKKVSMVFHNGSNSDYHLIIKELAEEFKKQLACLGENTGKHITFTVPTENEVTRMDKTGEEITKNISYILQFIDSARFMESSLSNLIYSLSEGIHRIKYKFVRDDKKYEACGIKYKYCDCFLEYTNFKYDLIEYKGLCCNKNYQHEFEEKLKERFFNTCKFFYHKNNKFISLLRKDIYPYEYMDEWKKFNET